MQLVNEQEINRIKSVTRLGVVDAGGAETCIEITRLKRHQTFSEYGNIECPGHVVPLDIAVAIDRFNGNYRLLRTHAELLSCAVVSLPAVLGTGAVAMSLGQATKEAGDVITSVGLALSDGTITPREAAKSRKEIREAVQALLTLDAVLEREQEGGA